MGECRTLVAVPCSCLWGERTLRGFGAPLDPGSIIAPLTQRLQRPVQQLHDLFLSGYGAGIGCDHQVFQGVLSNEGQVGF